ncbi:glutathione S-transferase N-terminal domain-containing protein [Azospirillum endophyticum]
MLTLRFSPASPFVRKCQIFAHEIGLGDVFTLIPTAPHDPDTDLPNDNPLGKIPALRTETGDAIYDSAVICDYLDHRHDGPKLIPAVLPERVAALTLQALADGIMDATVALRAEGLRPVERQHEPWIARQWAAVHRALRVLDSQADGWGNRFEIGQIATVSAVGYLDFRFATVDWRADAPALAGWFNSVSERRSVALTAPRD